MIDNTHNPNMKETKNEIIINSTAKTSSSSTSFYELGEDNETTENEINDGNCQEIGKDTKFVRNLIFEITPINIENEKSIERRLEGKKEGMSRKEASKQAIKQGRKEGRKEGMKEGGKPRKEVKEGRKSKKEGK